jgi:NodT family efflux transporter outer membrane factor (OMF) lipoprotein
MALTPLRSLQQCIGIFLLAMLTACSAVGPDYQPPSPELPAQWQATTGNVAVTPASDVRQWWTLFKDPLLDRLIQQAIAANQDLRIAETHIREARAARRVAGAAAQPALNSSAGANRSKSYENTANGATDAVDLFQAGFDAGWEIDLFGGVRRSVEAADASVEGSVENKRDVLIALTAEVARNYLDLRGGQQRLAIAKKNIINQEETVQMVLHRCELGLSSELELEQAKNQLYMTQSQVPGLETATIEAIYQLALLLNQQPQGLYRELSIEATIPAFPPALPLALPSELLRRRPDIRRAERQLAAATAEIGVATAELFPRFTFDAKAGLESANLSDLVTSGSRFWSFGPTVKWALFDGGRSRAGIEIKNAQRDRAQISYEKTVLSALIEVETALTAFSREQETNRTLRAAATAGQQAATIARKQYQLGLTDFLAVLVSEHSLHQSQDQLVQSEQRLSTGLVALFKALGGGWESRVMLCVESTDHRRTSFVPPAPLL